MTDLIAMTRQFARRLNALRLSDAGTAAVEFAMLSPVFLLLVAATVDIGGALYTKFRVDAAVSAGANYALVQNANVSSTGAPDLSTKIANLLSSSSATANTSGAVVINNGTTATLNASGAASTSGSAAAADSCYCPTGSGASLVWGDAVTCGGACSNGSIAGKFVSIVARQNYTPFFANYGIVQDGAISSSAVVQTQ